MNTIAWMKKLNQHQFIKTLQGHAAILGISHARSTKCQFLLNDNMRCPGKICFEEKNVLIAEVPSITELTSLRRNNNFYVCIPVSVENLTDPI